MVVLELTSAGWAAIWEWVKERAVQPEAQQPFDWYQHAMRCINLVPPGEELVVSMRGAVSRSGYMEALRLRPEWYRRIPRPTVELVPL